jgi:hypothetical protein
LLQKKALNNPLQSASEIKFGHNYYVITGPGEYSPRLVNSIDDFNEIKSLLN